MGCMRWKRRSKPAGGGSTRFWWPASGTMRAWNSCGPVPRGWRPRPPGAARAIDPDGPDARASRRRGPGSPAGISFDRRPVRAGPGMKTPEPACCWLSTASKTHKISGAAARGRRRRGGRCAADRAPLGPAQPGRRESQRRRSRTPAHRPRSQPGPRARRAEAPEPLDHRTRRTRDTDYDWFDLTGDCVLVLGREGAGLHDLVRRTCDHLLRIPMAGGVSSLNVSAAGAVVLFEAFRQRRNAAGSALPVAASASKPRKQKGLGS